MIGIIRKCSVFIQICILYALISCNLPHSENKIIYTRVRYVSPLALHYFRLDCNEINKTYIVDTVIIDRDFLDSLDMFLHVIQPTLKPMEIDAKICCTIVRENKDSSQIALGNYIGTVIDGQSKRDNLDLFFLIKKHTGYYTYYFYDRLYDFYELNSQNRIVEIKKMIKKKRLSSYKNMEEGNEGDTSTVTIEF